MVTDANTGGVAGAAANTENPTTMNWSQLTERLNYELDVITRMGYTGYFLIVWDFVNYARRNNIPVGPGRGSGAGSLVAYSLYITDIDPIHYRLLFERFLNPDRVSMPDFDIDFCYEKRGELIDYVTEKYGHDHVCQIITFGTLGARAVVRDVARVLDVPLSEADAIAKHIPFASGLAAALKSEKELRDIRARGGIHEKLFAICEKLEGLRRHASIHAAGIVIGRHTIKEYMPLYREPKSGNVTTQFSMDYLEECGLVKMDILGLKTLTLIADCQRLIRERVPEFDVDAIPMDDAETFAMLARGESAAVFQFENSGMQQLLKQAKPERIEDLIALTSLYRPGPMEHIDRYVSTKSGATPADYILPELKELLQETYGIIVYQEQVIEIVQKIAGFSLSRADLMRRAMGKKKAEVMVQMRKEFVSGAEGNGIEKNTANRIYDLLTPFAEYGFNKSHAAGYSTLAYQTAYLKAHYPMEFMAANLTNERNNVDQFYKYLQETKRMGIEVMRPTLEGSQEFFTVRDGRIIFGLAAIKTVGERAAAEIVRTREEDGPFESLTEFLSCMDMSLVNRIALTATIKTGVYDTLYPDRAALIENIDRYLGMAQEIRQQRKIGQQNLFDTSEAAVEIPSEPSSISPVEISGYEKELLGDYFGNHPLDEYKDFIEQMSPTLLADFDENTTGRHKVFGFVRSTRVSTSKRGVRMLVISLEDHSMEREIIKFYSRQRQPSENVEREIETDLAVAVPNTIIGANVTMYANRASAFVTVQELQTLRALEAMYARNVHIEFAHIPGRAGAIDAGVINDNAAANGSGAEGGADDVAEWMWNIRMVLLNRRGDSSVYFHIPNGQDNAEQLNGGANGSSTVDAGGSEGAEVVRASSDLRVVYNDELIAELGKIPLVNKVWLE